MPQSDLSAQLTQAPSSSRRPPWGRGGARLGGPAFKGFLTELGRGGSHSGMSCEQMLS